MGTIIDELYTKIGYLYDDRRLKAAEGDIKKAKAAAKDSAKEFDKLKASLAQLGVAFVAFKGMSLLVGGLVSTNREFGVLRARLETVTGSVQNAEAAFRFLQDFAKKTPFQVGELTDAFSKFKAQGIEPTVRVLTGFGNIAAGMGKSMDDITEAVLDAQMGEFERMKSFGIKMGKESGKVYIDFKGHRQLIENESGLIVDALLDIAEQNFAGGMERQSKTLDGAWSNLQDAAQDLALRIGDAGLTDALTNAAKTMADMLGNNDQLAKSLGDTLGVAVNSATDLLVKLVKQLSNIRPDQVRRAFDEIKRVVEIAAAAIEQVIKHWDVLVMTLAGAKTASAFGAVQVGLKGIGVAAAGALGPIGLIVQAFLTLLPIALKLGDALGDVMSDMSKVGRDAAAFEAAAGGRKTKREAAKGFASKETGAAVMAAQGEVQRLATRLEGVHSVDGRRAIEKELGRAKYRLAVAQAKDATERRRLELKTEADAKLYAASDAAFEAREAALLQESEGRNLRLQKHEKTARFGELMAAKKRRKLKPSEAKELRDLGKELDEATTEFKGKKGKKKKPDLSEGSDMVKSRIDDLVEQAELRAFTNATGVDLAGREKIAKEAGAKERARLTAAANAGNLHALGGEFSRENQLLRDAGIIDDVHKASPPVLTVSIVRVTVDAPVSVAVKEAPASAELIASTVAKSVRQVWETDINAAIAANTPVQRR